MYFNEKFYVMEKTSSIKCFPDITKLWLSTKLKNMNSTDFVFVCDKRTGSKVRFYLVFLKCVLGRALTHQMIIRHQKANIRITEWKSGYLFLFSGSIMYKYCKANTLTLSLIFLMLRSHCNSFMGEDNHTTKSNGLHHKKERICNAHHRST